MKKMLVALLDKIYLKLRFLDRPELGDWAAAEQDDLDRMWKYLEEREAVE